MPTTRGWLVGSLGLGLIVASRGFGSEALGQIGLAFMVLVIAAVTAVRSGRHDLQIARSLQPFRVGAGKTVTVTIDLVNQGRGSMPLLLIEDHVPAQLGLRARFAFTGIEPRGTRRVAYKVRPALRGRYTIGPFQVSYLDPFSLAQRQVSVGTADHLLVHPRIDQLTMPRDLGERRSLSISALRRPTGTEGEDFYTLREYIEGDDLRKIHWPSTAKKQRYMIRQEETPWHNRATLIIDDRRAAYSLQSEAFERAVEATASLVDLYQRAGFSFRLTGAHEPGFQSSRGADHYSRCLDLLATISLRSPATSGLSSDDPLLLARFAELDSRNSAQGVLVLASGDLTSEIAVALARLRRRFRQVVVLSFPSHRFGTSDTRARWEGETRMVEAVRLLTRSAVRPIILGPGDSFRNAWASLSRASAGGGYHWEQKQELV